MKKYKRIVMEFFGFAEQDVIPCENCCKAVAVDIHHIELKGMGGRPRGDLDVIDNLVCLCRGCHDKAHRNPEFNQALKHLTCDDHARKTRMRNILRKQL